MDIDTEKMVMVKVGDEEWIYSVVCDSRGREVTVKLYDESGKYVTEFSSEEEMREYIGGMTDVRLNGLKAIRQFRKMNHEEMAEDSFDSVREDKDEVKTEFSKRLRMLRGEMGRKMFAKVLGIEYGLEYGYETERRSPMATSLKRISERTGVSVDWLLGRDE